MCLFCNLLPRHLGASQLKSSKLRRCTSKIKCSKTPNVSWTSVFVKIIQIEWKLAKTVKAPCHEYFETLSRDGKEDDYDWFKAKIKMTEGADLDCVWSIVCTQVLIAGLHTYFVGFQLKGYLTVYLKNTLKDSCTITYYLEC